MKRTKYGKNRQKTIYVPESYDKIWQHAVDEADKQGEGVGILLLNAWNEKKDESILRKM